MSGIADAYGRGCRVAILVRHAERPPLNPFDRTFGASLPLTERGWNTARQYGSMLAHAVRPSSVSFYASETFRTIQTACAMAIGLDEAGEEYFIGRKVRLSRALGGESPFFGSADERWALIAEGNYHDRVNDYFRLGQMRGYRPLKDAVDEMDRALDRMHGGDSLVVAVTHDINVASFLAGRGVERCFTDETWPGYLDAAVAVRRPDGHSEYGVLRGQRELEEFYRLPLEA